LHGIGFSSLKNVSIKVLGCVSFGCRVVKRQQSFQKVFILRIAVLGKLKVTNLQGQLLVNIPAGCIDSIHSDFFHNKVIQKSGTCCFVLFAYDFARFPVVLESVG